MTREFSKKFARRKPAVDDRVRVIEAPPSFIQRGFEMAREFRGSLEGLRIEPGQIVRRHLVASRQSTYEKEVVELEAERNFHCEREKQINESLSGFDGSGENPYQDKIDKYEAEYEEAKSQPNRISLFSLLPFAISIIMMIFLSFYLYFFYVGLSDRAFHFDLNSAVKTAQSTGDLSQLGGMYYNPQAFQEALTNRDFGVLFLPVIFLSIAILIHVFFMKKIWIGVIAWLLTALVVDLCFAYKIAETIHQIHVKTDMSTGEMTLGRALTDIQLLLIIAVGYLAYVVLGFMGVVCTWQHEGLYPRIKELADKKEKVRALEAEKAEFDTTIKAERETLEQELDGVKKNLDENKLMIERNTNLSQMAGFNWSTVNGQMHEFYQGWIMYLSQKDEIEPGVQERMIKEAREVFESAMSKVGNDLYLQLDVKGEEDDA